MTIRTHRERLAVDARAAIQNARFWLDYEPERDPKRAVEWAANAVKLAEEFHKCVETEAKGGSDGR